MSSGVQLCRFAAWVLENGTAEYQIEGRVETMVPIWLHRSELTPNQFCSHRAMMVESKLGLVLSSTSHQWTTRYHLYVYWDRRGCIQMWSYLVQTHCKSNPGQYSDAFAGSVWDPPAAFGEKFGDPQTNLPRFERRQGRLQRSFWWSVANYPNFLNNNDAYYSVPVQGWPKGAIIAATCTVGLHTLELTASSFIGRLWREPQCRADQITSSQTM